MVVSAVRIFANKDLARTVAEAEAVGEDLVSLPRSLGSVNKPEPRLQSSQTIPFIT